MLALVGYAHFGGDPVEESDLNTEERGLTSNLAYLFAYSDAVVITESKKRLLPSVLEIDEAISLKKGLNYKKGEFLHIDSNSDNYFDNKREVIFDLSNPNPRPTNNRKYSGPIFPRGLETKALYFLRASKRGDAPSMVRKWEHKVKKYPGIICFKAINGEEGQIILNEDIMELSEENSNDKLRLKLAKRQLQSQKERWQYESTKEFLDFTKAYYSEAGLNDEQLNSPLGKRLQKDALELVKALSKDKIPNFLNKSFHK